MKYLFLIIILLTCSFSSEYKKVLFISSYNSSFPTVSKQIEGIKEVLNEKNYQLDIEFMDTKRFNPKIIEPMFYKMLKSKKNILIGYDAILVGDDNALHFVDKYKEELFSKKPIVFLAINNIQFAKKISLNKNITGIIETASINETINLIKSMHPNNKKIIAIRDNTVTSKAIIKSFDNKILESLEFFNISAYSFSELREQLIKIPINQPLLYISAFLDKNKKTKEFYDSIQLIKDNTNSPMYHFYEHGIGQGLIGGKVVLFKEQGILAAKVVKVVLSGTHISGIKPRSSENKFLFDYREVEKYKLMQKIPEDAIFINKPVLFFEQKIVDLLLQIIIFLLVVFLAVIYLLYKLNKNSKQLTDKTNEQATLLSMFDHGDNVLFKWKNDKNFTISHVSENVSNLLSYSTEDFIQNKIIYYNCIHGKDKKNVLKEFNLVKKSEDTFFRHTPYRLITKDNEVKWVVGFTVPIKDRNGVITHFLAYLLDITKEKRIQSTLEKLIDSQSSMIVLADGKQLSFANKKFYDFFKCKSIPEFHLKYKSLSSLFVENDRFFHLGKIDKKDSWMDKIQTFPENERVITIADTNFNLCAFSVNSNNFDDDLYLISFTDISETMLEQIKLEEKIIHDKLTGAFNREYFDSKYPKFIAECKKSNDKFGLAFLDIDFFKKINDNYGHDVGDSVLIELVEKIIDISRDDDILFRWGGEEFVLILKVKSIDNLFKALENNRIKIENHNFNHIKNLTCSIGGTIYKDEEEIEKTIKRADVALYKAKKSGRNKVLIEQ